MQELSDEEYAARIVDMLLSSFPNGRPRDPDTYVRQMVQTCVGEPRELLREMVHPKRGVISDLSFLPTVGEVNTWLRDHKPRTESASYHRKFLPEPEPESVSPEERARRVEMLRGVAEQIRDVAKTNCVGRPIDWKKTQRKHSLSELAKTDLLQS